MGERKGQNHYYPPDFDPKKHGNLNAYHGTHALRERARKLDQGILIIRFEMPYNIWCDGCKKPIAQSVRYNAQKSKNGMYYTTPIHHFRMKCHMCDMHFEIETDPGNMDYKIISGCRRKEQRWDMAENEQIVTEEKSDIKKLAADPMFKLEHDTKDESKVVKIMPSLRELQHVQTQWKDDFALNQLMRGTLRSEKKVIKEQTDSDNKFLDKWNINIDLVRENEHDIKIAKLYKFNSELDNDDTKNNEMSNEETRSKKRKTIEFESIFDNEKNPKNSKRSRTQSLIPLNTFSKNSKQSQIKGLQKKLNKSLTEKKLNNSNISLDEMLFQLKPNDILTINQSKEDNDSNYKNKILKSVVKSSTSLKSDEKLSDSQNNVSTNSLVSNDYGLSSSSDENAE